MKEKITVELGKEEVGFLIKKFIEEKYPNYKIGEVSFDIGTRTEGYGHGEHQVVYFEGVNVSLTR